MHKPMKTFTDVDILPRPFPKNDAFVIVVSYLYRKPVF